jgi:hypothetical protein
LRIVFFESAPRPPGLHRRELRVQPIEVDRRDLLQLQIAERGLDVDPDLVSIPGDRRRSTTGERRGREPFVEVLAEGDPSRTNVRAVLQIGERLVERGLRVLPRAEAALTNLLPPSVRSTDVQHESPRAPRLLDASGLAHSGFLRGACREDALVLSTDVCTKDAGGLDARLHARLYRSRWSPFGHGDHESRRKTANIGGRQTTRKQLLSRLYAFS